MTAESARLEIRGASLVLTGAYTTTQPVRTGDTLKVAGEWRIAPTDAADDEAIVGTAWNSAAQGQPVDVIIAGLARIALVDDVARGDILGPSSTKGQGARRQGPQRRRLLERQEARRRPRIEGRRKASLGSLARPGLKPRQPQDRPAWWRLRPCLPLW